VFCSLFNFLLFQQPPKTAAKTQGKAKPTKPSGGKAKKKKWSKGKTRDKLDNIVIFTPDIEAKFYKECVSYKLITPAVISERMKIGGSLARKALRDMCAKGLIKCVVKHGKQVIYTRSINDAEEEEEEKEKA